MNEDNHDSMELDSGSEDNNNSDSDNSDSDDSDNESNVFEDTYYEAKDCRNNDEVDGFFIFSHCVPFLSSDYYYYDYYILHTTILNFSCIVNFYKQKIYKKTICE